MKHKFQKKKGKRKSRNASKQMQLSLSLSLFYLKNVTGQVLAIVNAAIHIDELLQRGFLFNAGIV